MSFLNLPQPTEIRITPSGSTYDIRVETSPEAVPPDIVKFLEEAGWKQFNFHPDTTEPLFEKKVTGINAGYEETIHCRWSEAMAYEFYRFLTIGDK